MIVALIASSLLSLHAGDVCRLPANVALIEPGRVNWLLKDRFFRLPEATSAIVVRINPEQVEGVAELKVYDGTNRRGWVESRNLVAVKDTIPSIAVASEPSAATKPPASATAPRNEIKPYGVKVAKRRRRQLDFSAVEAAMAGMADATFQSQAGTGYGIGARSSGCYYGPRQPPGTYIGGDGSSHRGGHYSNPNTGDRYQKRN